MSNIKMDSIGSSINGCKHPTSGIKNGVFLQGFLILFALNGHIWYVIELDIGYQVYLGFIQFHYYYNHVPYFMAS